MTRKELADLYGISESTLRRWLRSIGIMPCKSQSEFTTNQRRLTPNDLELIKKEFGDPSIYKDFGKPGKILEMV
jgi:DNA-binding transcriptional MerR regulator